MSEYNIQMNKYNALNAEYDQLYPATKIKNVNGLHTALQKKADDSSVYTKEESISAETRTALGISETATPDAALAEIARQLSESGTRIVKRYENAAPNSAFPAQEISMDLSNAKFVLIGYKQNETDNIESTETSMYTGIGIVGTRTQIMTNRGIMCYRTCIINTSGISFSNGFALNQYAGAPSANSSRVIPLYVWSIE